jgi:cell division transport system permease protein
MADRLADPWAEPGTRGPTAWARGAERWVRDHARVARESAAFVSHRLPTSLLVWLLIGIALALPGGLYLLQVNLAAIADRWEGKPGVTVYFEVGAGEAVARALERKLEREEGVHRVVLVTAEAALAEFRQYTGVADALTHLGRNPLPASLRIVLEDGARPEAFERLATRLSREAGVEEVTIERTWLERLAAMTGVVRRLSYLLAALFALGAVLVTATSVRLAIEGRLEELRVMKLVGATDAYLRRPFLYFGLLYGLGGGLAGAMLISAVLVIIESPLAALVGSYGSRLDVAGLTVGFFLGLFALGGALGVCGARVAVWQRLQNLDIG